ncbi:hypothetical protein ACFE04_014541 [Oxalis oulophora]
MLAKESSGVTFDLAEEVLEVLPSDPFEQLDVARKITSIALSTRLSSLESELSLLNSKLDEKDQLIAELQTHVDSLESTLSDSNDKLTHAHVEKEDLLKDNARLSNTVKKLQRDVAKLEVFRKTLMQSLQEDEDGSGGGGGGAPVAKPTPNGMGVGARLIHKVIVLLWMIWDEKIGYHERVILVVSEVRLRSTEVCKSFELADDDDDATLPPSATSSIRSQISDLGSSVAEDRETEATSRPGRAQGLPLFSQTTTPRLTPPGSPPILSASVSPTRTSKPASPRRHSISFATSRGMFDDRSSLYSSQHSSVSSESGSQTGRTRVDGKEFFRQVRSRLSYEQFGAFLANVKELNAHKQNKEETLRKANEIFGPDNRDLYTIFEGLITRNVH